MIRSEKIFKMNNSSRNLITGYLLVFPVVILICIAMGGAAVYCFILSFKDLNMISSSSANFVGLQTYKEILFNSETLITIRNSIIWVISGTSLIVAIGLAVGTLLSNTGVISRVARSLMLMPWVLPGVIVAGLWKWMYHPQTGLINKYIVDLGLAKEGISWLGQVNTALLAVVIVVVWKLFPLFSLVVASAIQTVDNSMYEAARIDGTTPWNEFWLITLPCIKYQVLTISMLNAIWVMNNLVLVNLMTGGGPLYYSQTLPVYMFKLGFKYTKLSQASAVTMINFSILLIMSIIYLHIFRKNQEKD